MEKVQLYLGSALIVAVISPQFEMVVTVGDMRKFFFGERAHEGMAAIGFVEVEDLELIKIAANKFRQQLAVSSKELGLLHKLRDKISREYNVWKKDNPRERRLS